MKVAKYVVCAAIVALSTACDAANFAYTTFDDRMISFEQTVDASVLTGRKGIYVLSGVLKAVGKHYRPGEAILLTGSAHFRLKELLDRYPELRQWSDIAEEEAKQEKAIARHRIVKHGTYKISSTPEHRAP